MATLRGHSSPVHLLLVLGRFLLSADESGELRVWDTTSNALHSIIELQCTPTVLMHPSTYINKVSQSGWAFLCLGWLLMTQPSLLVASGGGGR